MKTLSALTLAALLATTGAARATNFEDAATAVAANTLCRSDMFSIAEIGVAAIGGMKDTGIRNVETMVGLVFNEGKERAAELVEAGKAGEFCDRMEEFMQGQQGKVRKTQQRL